MQNTYIKELAIKTYQEERAIEYAASKNNRSTHRVSLLASSLQFCLFSSFSCP